MLKKEKAISLGNLIGSNIFNILAVVGITSIITPITANDSALYTHDIYWMLGISLILPLLVVFAKKNATRTKEWYYIAHYYMGCFYIKLFHKKKEPQKLICGFYICFKI